MRTKKKLKTGFLISFSPTCARLPKARLLGDPPFGLSWIPTHLARLSLGVTRWLHHVTRSACRVTHEVVTNWLSCNPLCIFRSLLVGPGNPNRTETMFYVLEMAPHMFLIFVMVRIVF